MSNPIQGHILRNTFKMIQDHKMWLCLHFLSTYCNPSLSQIRASSVKIKIQSMTQVESIEFFTFTATRREVQKGEKKKNQWKYLLLEQI